ncbi:transposase [Streptococcus azizii]|uniref:transposase n=2 Tax=Streptococcus TaxID=1301 RepID=UPI002447C02D|nr:transposase [Streptococcus azizii]
MMDNATFHPKKQLDELCIEHHHFFLPLPPYSPELNPIETAWANLKKAIIELLPLKPMSFNTYLRTHFSKSGIQKGEVFNLTTHALRHSHISLLAELNVPLKLIMERVGHGDEKTTLEIYTHVTDTMREDLKGKLENMEIPKKYQKSDKM